MFSKTIKPKLTIDTSEGKSSEPPKQTVPRTKKTFIFSCSATYADNPELKEFNVKTNLFLNNSKNCIKLAFDIIRRRPIVPIEFWPIDSEYINLVNTEFIAGANANLNECVIFLFKQAIKLEDETNSEILRQIKECLTWAEKISQGNVIVLSKDKYYFNAEPTTDLERASLMTAILSHVSYRNSPLTFLFPSSLQLWEQRILKISYLHKLFYTLSNSEIMTYNADEFGKISNKVQSLRLKWEKYKTSTQSDRTECAKEIFRIETEIQQEWAELFLSFLAEKEQQRAFAL